MDDSHRHNYLHVGGDVVHLRKLDYYHYSSLDDSHHHNYLDVGGDVVHLRKLGRRQLEVHSIETESLSGRGDVLELLVPPALEK